MLTFNPQHRISASDALQHPYFNDCDEAHLDDGVVQIPDDGEGKSTEEIFRVLQQMQQLLRSRLAVHEQQYSDDILDM